MFRTAAPEDTLKTGSIPIARKTFLFALKENTGGRFLGIKKEFGMQRARIIMPAPDSDEFHHALDGMARAAGKPAEEAQRP